MKAKDLMIGDWVNSPFRGLWQIQFSDFSQMRRFISEDGELGVTPIPLTEDILKANGFVWNDAMELWEYVIRHDYPFANIEVKLETEESSSPVFEVYVNNNIGGNVDGLHFVHELQHALRLCGLRELADNLKVE